MEEKTTVAWQTCLINADQHRIMVYLAIMEAIMAIMEANHHTMEEEVIENIQLRQNIHLVDPQEGAKVI